MTAKVMVVDIRSADGWMTATLVLDDASYEICSMISPSRDASLRVEIIEHFERLVSKIVESLVRDQYPDLEFSSKTFHAKEGNA